jgi:hypothetical protein
MELAAKMQRAYKSKAYVFSSSQSRSAKPFLESRICLENDGGSGPGVKRLLLPQDVKLLHRDRRLGMARDHPGGIIFRRTRSRNLS